jgi:Zn-dependent protease with chaperone function
MLSTSKSGSDDTAPGSLPVVNGSWFVAGSALRHTATLTLAGALLEIRGDGQGADYPVAQARVADFGDAVTLEFTDGGAFVVASGQADTPRLLGALQGKAPLVRRLERRWQTVAIALVGTVGLGALLLLVVLPALARPVAGLVPPAWSRLIDDQALPVLDRMVLAPSALPEADRARIEGDMQALVTGLQLDAERFRLLFRSGDGIGANAFAMPGGTIVVTDRMAELASPEELAAVLTHEIGHVERRHGLQQILRKSTLAIILVLVGPDAGTISELAQGLPAVLLDSGYSRAFEREADLYACRSLTQLGRSPEPLASALERLAAEHPDGPAVPAWVSSHPDTDERIAKIRSYRPGSDAFGE